MKNRTFYHSMIENTSRMLEWCGPGWYFIQREGQSAYPVRGEYGRDGLDPAGVSIFTWYEDEFSSNSIKWLDAPEDMGFSARPVRLRVSRITLTDKWTICVSRLWCSNDKTLQIERQRHYKIGDYSAWRVGTLVNDASRIIDTYLNMRGWEVTFRVKEPMKLSKKGKAKS